MSLIAMTNRVGAGKSAPNELNTVLNAGITNSIMMVTTTNATTTTAIARPPLVRHACVRLRAEAAELGCARCHGGAVPAGPRECLYVEGRRPECAACHEVPR